MEWLTAIREAIAYMEDKLLTIESAKDRSGLSQCYLDTCQEKVCR